ncbi:MAG TPA: VIT domain-containing protein, partial [Planctomycetota bacterium]|nr:VIT domain-containing protein [Planctomycetota bacterium]
MTCLDMESRIAEFLAGELDDRAGVEEHLVACAECRSKFSIARSGWEAATEWRAPNPSGDAITATLAALEPAAPSKPLLRFLQIGSLAASVVIACAIGSTDRTPVREEPVRPVPPSIAGPKSIGLASLRPSVGVLFARDEEGRPAGELAIQRLNVRVEIRDGLAWTEIEQTFRNRTDRRLEGTFQFPLPPDASISRLAMEIEGKLMEGEVVERQKARQTYEGIVRSMKDPALLEWMPGGLFQCRIFPIEARSDKRIVIAYTQALSVFDGGARYVYPLAGESTRELGIGRFEFSAMIRSGAKIVKAESTSHAAASIRLDDRTMRTTFAATDFRPRSDFVVAFESEARSEIQVSAHRPEGTEPGYFTAFITPRLDGEEEPRKDRKLFFLIDVSGSVGSPEIEAARVVIRRMVGKLAPADRFRIGSHNLMVGAMPSSVAPDEEGKRAADRYVSDLTIAGASDVATSLETVMSEYMTDGSELVYVGEGTPTWGEKDPAKIVARVRRAMGDRRVSIRTIAVGSDADKGLLETLAREFNGGAHAISASDDVAARADEIARTLGRTAISNLKAEFIGAVTETAPGTLGSLHFGERLLVTGRYAAGPAKLILTGRVHDKVFRKEFALALPERVDGNPHVKRLWAQRRLADLVAQGAAKRDETVKLSVAHQVMTPYTSFLVLENEKSYEQHQIDRTKKDADQTKDPKILKLEESQRAREEVHRKLDQRRELELLLGQAQIHFEKEQYEKCIDVCDRVLTIDPRLSSVDEMKMIAQRLMHVRADRDLTRTYIEQWKRTFENVDVIGVVQPDELSFPARELWLKAIKSRKPKGILGDDSAQEWDQLHRKLVGKQRVDEQERQAQSDEHYRLAIRFYDSGEFEKAENECQKALSLNGNHGAAHALMLEVQFALGKGRVTPQSLEFEQIIQMSHARQQQVIFEIREAMDNGNRAFNQGNLGDAERHFRTIIEYSKWLPKSDALEAQRRQAAEMLGKFSQASTPALQSPAAGDTSTGRTNMGYSVLSVPSQEGTLGKLINDPTLFDRSFLEADGGEEVPYAESKIEQTANGGLAFSLGEGTRSNRGPIRDSGAAMAGAGFTLDDPIFDSIPRMDFFYRKPPVFGINQSVTITGTGVTETLSLLVDGPAPDPLANTLFNPGGLTLQYEWIDYKDTDALNRPPSGGGGNPRPHPDVRSLELQLMQAHNLLARAEEAKKRAEDGCNSAASADQDRLYRIQEVERISKELARD